MIEIKKIGMGLWTLADGIAGKSEGLGDQVETAVDLAGLLGKPLISAVPLFGTYWNDFLVPLTKACVARLKRLEDQSDRINREHLMQLITWQETPNGWRPLGPAPQLDRPAKVYACASRPHGIAVFNYLYSVMQGEPAAISDEVEEILLHQRDTLEKLVATRWSRKTHLEPLDVVSSQTQGSRCMGSDQHSDRLDGVLRRPGRVGTDGRRSG